MMHFHVSHHFFSPYFVLISQYTIYKAIDGKNYGDRGCRTDRVGADC